MTKKLKKLLYRIIISGIFFVLAIALPISVYFKLSMFIIAYLIIGHDILLKSLKNIINGHIFDENFFEQLVISFKEYLIGKWCTVKKLDEIIQS